jgi:hypothetical protein
MLTMLTAAIPSADPLPLPAPPWFLWTLLLVTFVVHVLAMNFVLGGSIIAAAARLRGGDDHVTLARWLARLMPTLVATTITFGVAPLLFVQALYGRLFFTSSVLMAWFWWAVVPVLILAYYGTYLLSFRGEKLGRAAGWIAGGVAVLFAAIAFVYTNNMTLMLRADRFLAMYLEDARGVHLNLSDPTVIPRYLHMLLGATAVAGLIVAIYGVAKWRTDEAHGRWAVRHGANWFVAATIINMLVGVWWLGSLPADVMKRFVSTGAAVALTLGVIGGFVALLLMVLAAREPQPARFVKWSAVALFATVVAMILSRDEVRRGMLQSIAFQPTTWIEPQWGVIAIFVALLVAAVATTVWMAGLLLRPRM